MIDRAPVYWYDELDSTSEEAKRRARAGELGPLWIAARQQSAGRGRLGRTWVSPIGNLFSTILFPEPEGLAMAGRVPFAAALAVRDTCSLAVPGLPAQLKWPNDVRIAGQKLSGILTETGETNNLLWVALGIGINIEHAPDIPGIAATSLRAEGAPAAMVAEHFLQDLRAGLGRRLEQMRRDFSGLLVDWLKHAEGHGQLVTAGPLDNRIEGVFEGLAEDGGMILRLPDGAQRIIRAGDVELVKRVS